MNFNYPLPIPIDYELPVARLQCRHQMDNYSNIKSQVVDRGPRIDTVRLCRIP